MIQLPNVGLPEQTARALSALQARVNAMVSYRERVRHARERFSAENRSDNETFRVVRYTLDTMCAGSRRCMYCQDSAACEVEHFRPKTFYPELAFAWLNYLYSCGICNRIKGSNFRVLSDTSEYVSLVRRRGDAVVEPQAGSSVLIDPRSEDPMQFMGLDLIDTFFFVPRNDRGPEVLERATYTIECLKLNDRDYLTHARKEAYGAYRARLHEYVEAKGTGREEPLAKAISGCHHRPVWAQMKAQSEHISDLSHLFHKAPEAFQW